MLCRTYTDQTVDESRKPHSLGSLVPAKEKRISLHAHSWSARRCNIFSSTFARVVQQMIAAHSHTWTLERQGPPVVRAAIKEKKSSKRERSATTSSSASANTSPAGSIMARGSSNGSAPIVTTSPACAFLACVLCVDRRPHSTLPSAGGHNPRTCLLTLSSIGVCLRSSPSHLVRYCACVRDCVADNRTAAVVMVFPHVVVAVVRSASTWLSST